MTKYWFDYRFFVEAETGQEATDKIVNYLPESVDDIWYTIADSSFIHPEVKKNA